MKTRESDGEIKTYISTQYNHLFETDIYKKMFPFNHTENEFRNQSHSTIYEIFSDVYTAKTNPSKSKLEDSRPAKDEILIISIQAEREWLKT